MTLTELVRRGRVGWRRLAAGALAGGLLATTVHLALPPRFEAVAVVRVDAPAPEQVDMVAEQAVASSRRVTTEALASLDDGSTHEELESSTDVRALKGSRVLEVTRSAETPQDAARGADAVAQAYLAARAVDSAGDPAGPSAAVVDPARVPTSPAGPSLGVTALGGLVLGSLVAAPWAAARGAPTRSRADPAS